MKIFISLLILSVFCFNFNIMAQEEYSYLALGDSYTIGESVEADKTWSAVLSQNLRKRGVNIVLEKVVATTGWTTDELLTAIDSDSSSLNDAFDVVSLLIGVNNQYRGYSVKQYQVEFEILLKRAIDLAGKKASRVFVVSIPDYGITPFAKENGKNAGVICKELAEYNKIAKNISDAYGVVFFDITPISLKAIWDKDLIADDKLHPSAKMYADWAEYIAPGVYQLLEK